MGTPLVADKLYGTADPLYLSVFKKGYRHSHRKGSEKPLIDRLALHAKALSFKHPVSGDDLRFDVDPPKDFSAAVYQLGKFGR
jgi:23S rRNA pseudouridine955/2504/2580 synthase/23S rRNA pseudouridine1911/1915/1917 synthase